MRIASMNKTCSRCKELKPITEFSKKAQGKDGLATWCRACGSKYYYENRERIRGQQRASYMKNKEVVAEYRKRYYAKNKETAKLYQLQKMYGMSGEDMQGMMNRCKGCCEICGDSFSHDNLHYVDHCHDTGNVRGLLCRNCNSGIGLLKDNVGVMLKAIEYLKDKGSSHE